MKKILNFLIISAISNLALAGNSVQLAIPNNGVVNAGHGELYIPLDKLYSGKQFNINCKIQNPTNEIIHSELRFEFRPYGTLSYGVIMLNNKPSDMFDINLAAGENNLQLRNMSTTVEWDNNANKYRTDARVKFINFDFDSEFIVKSCVAEMIY